MDLALNLSMKLPITLLLILLTIGNLYSEEMADVVGTEDQADKQERSRLSEIIEKEARLVHAKELLGKHYKNSFVKSGEQIDQVATYIEKWVNKGLPKKWKKRSQEISRTICSEAAKYDLDPIFVLSMIEAESSVNPESLGPFKEQGLMQLKKETAQWIAKKMNIKIKGEIQLTNPELNIKLGVAYIAWLRNQFNAQSQYYLAAYNMGATNVKRALSKDIKPKDYPIHVMKRYLAHYEELEGIVN